jgi:hypothetical protein
VGRTLSIANLRIMVANREERRGIRYEPELFL